MIMIQKANAKYEATVTKLKKSSRCNASGRAILWARHARGVYFRQLCQKPVLTEEDVSERLAFAKKFETKSAA